MEKPTPEFAIFQNSRTRRSAMWTKGAGAWKEFPERDFLALQTMTMILRSSPNPPKTLDDIIKAITDKGWEQWTDGE
jgi:hypothetical protein